MISIANIMGKAKGGLLFLIPAAMLTSCTDLFEPGIENHLGMEYMYEHPDYADGVLGNAYTRIAGYNAAESSDLATDDAVSNNADLSYRKMNASGNWAANNNPLETWRNSRAAIQYINLFIENIDKIQFNKKEHIDNMYRQRYLGESYGLRAYFMAQLLQAHGGYAEDGKLYGVPLLENSTSVSTNHSELEKRATYAECMTALIADAKKAIEYLPVEYANTNKSSQTITAMGKSYTVNEAEYNRVFGIEFKGRMSGRIARAILAQATLVAASPAYSDQSGVTWEDAANYAADILKVNDGLNGFDPTGNTWYCNTADIKDIAIAGESPKEILWRSSRADNNTLEAACYPPSIYGLGRVNPTQNLVDAFPMADGTPIASSSSYNAQDPYANRDPRLALYILYNGQTAGINNTTINTQADNTSNLDGLNKDVTKSTRTGYYMRKNLRQDVNLDPSVNSTQFHYTPRIRFTELYLAYAEAANEQWGPTTPAPGVSFSAYQVIKKIRERAGITNDQYLEQCKSSKDKMRELIHNERRIELCFEGKRFWDLRRWKANLNETAKGVSITTSATGAKTYQSLNVEAREYDANAYYGPIPYDQILNFSSLIQNKGW